MAAAAASSGTLLTVGHGALPPGALEALLRGAGLEALVDVRIAPGSRRHPHFARAVLEQSLPEAGIAYRWDPRLGGRRRPRPDSPNTGLRNDSFRGYADHMRGPEFAAALEELADDARSRPLAIMCSEQLWWRCHRRLVADYLLSEGVPVGHIMGPGKIEPARLTPGAQPQPDGTILYAGEAAGTLL